MNTSFFCKLSRPKIVAKTILGVVILIGLASFSPGENDQEVMKEIVSNFKNYFLLSREEKVYLQTDKPYYSAGENIWFKGYLVNAASLQPRLQAMSQYLYVELINRMDSVVSRVKIHKDSTGFAGYIKLKPDLPSGDYNLRAYTYWMQNNSPDFFFRKTLYIGNRIDDEVNCKATYGAPTNGKVLVHLQFSNSNFQPITGRSIYILENGLGVKDRNNLYVLDSLGRANVSIPYQESRDENEYLDVSIDDQDLKYQTSIYLPDFSHDFDVQFFPESGVFLNNCLQVVAFKAIGTDGLSESITGKVYSNNGIVKSEIVSNDKGMGKFVLNPVPEESYYAIIRSERGDEKRFDLPKATDEGVSLHVVFFGDKVFYEVTDKRADTSKSLFMLLHARGVPYMIMPLVNLSGQFRQDQLNPGIYAISILDSVGNTQCERLFFSTTANLPSVKMETDKAAYGRRESVDLSFTIQPINGKSPEGSYSVSVTDQRLVLNDSLNDNMVSYLLLSSDIKGHVEDPLSYFAGDPIDQSSRLDLLMQTQAWRCYNTAEVAQHRFKMPDSYIEVGQTLSGRVLNVLGRPPKECSVYAFGPGVFTGVKTDSLGRYLINGIQFQDSTCFMLKAQKAHRIPDVEIIPDKDVFPSPQTFFTSPQAIPYSFPNEYFEQSKQKYYIEGGMRMVHLDEVKIYGDTESNDPLTNYYSGWADSEMDAETIEQYAGMTLFDILSTLPGVEVTGTEVRIRGSDADPSLLIDGIPEMDLTELSYLEPSEVDKIEVFKGANAAMFGLSGSNGVIAISIKKGAVIERTSSISVARFSPLGIQKPEQFYVPKYEVIENKEDPKQDMRTTIYWNPSLVCDSTGILRMSFFTADPEDDYTVTLEGITNEGRICHFVGTIKRAD
jgi:hypothetical protein